MEQKYIDRIINRNNDKILFLLTPPGYGKSVRIPTLLSKTLKLLVIVTNNLYANYFELRTKSVDYTASSNLWNTIIEKYNKNKCKLDFDYDLIIFDDYTDENLEYVVLIKLLQGCNFKNIMLQSSNVITSIFDVDLIDIPFVSFHTDIRYYDTNYDYDDRKLLKDMSRLIINFNESTVEGNFLIVLPKSFLVNSLYSMLNEIKTGLVLKFTHYDSLESLNSFISEEAKNPLNDIRKIVIITDTLEPLLSLPRLGMIFETGFESKLQNTLTGGKRKVVVPISIERLEKYCSRLNMKFPGICFRMFTRDKIEMKKNIKTTSGIFWYQILQLKSKGLESLIDYENEEIKASFDTLKILNICNDYKEDSCVFANESYLGIRNSLTLFQLLKNKFMKQFIILLCFIDNYDPYFYRFPKKNKEENDTQYTLRLLQFKQDLLLRFGGYNDIDMFSNIWNDHIEKVKDPYIESPPFINNHKWYLLLKLIKNTFDSVKIKESNLDILIDQDLKKYIVNNYQDRILSLDEDNNYYVDGSSGSKYRLDQKFSLNLLSSKPPKSIINLVDLNVNLEGGVRFVLLALDI